MACGLGAVLFAIHQRYFEGALILILGGIFDSVDGRLARLTGTESNFGEQFDSMSDMISFGFAPAILMYQKYLHQFGRLGVAVTFSYVLFGALRLARFNASMHKIPSVYFQGLPSPVSAGAIAGYILLAGKYPALDRFPGIPAAYTFIYGLMMITDIPFPSFKESEWIRRHKRTSLFIFFLIAVLTFIYYKIMFALGITVYVVLSLVFVRKRYIKTLFQWKDEDDH